MAIHSVADTAKKNHFSRWDAVLALVIQANFPAPPVTAVMTIYVSFYTNKGCRPHPYMPFLLTTAIQVFWYLIVYLRGFRITVA
ncbi:MAG: hypothetical protein K2I86_02985, partial [Prevotella sp.]|nr:hypothetical protein [Prevotella sp.]